MAKVEKFRMRRNLANFICFLMLFVGATIMIGPFLWMSLSAVKRPIEIIHVPPTLLPEHPTLENFREVLKIIPFARYYMNSILVSVVVTLGALFFNSLGGYIFAKFKFVGRDMLFLIILATLMIPYQLCMIPLYLIMSRTGLIDTYEALIIPGLVSPFGIFLMRQFIGTIPNSLLDSARIDGCSEFGIFIKIILPSIKPALAALGIFIFLWTWNDYLWPLIVINSMHMRTLPIGLATLKTQHIYKYGLILAATTMTVGPIIGVFLFFQQWFIKGITLTGIKG